MREYVFDRVSSLLQGDNVMLGLVFVKKRWKSQEKEDERDGVDTNEATTNALES